MNPTDDTSLRTATPCNDASQASGDSFRLMADSAPVMIWATGIDKGFEWLNRTWLEFSGRSLADERGTGWLAGVHAEDRERCSGIYDASFDARQPFTMDFRLRRHDGCYRWVLATGVPRHSPDGSFHGYTGSCIDIHERKELEERLAERTRALRLADRRKDEFLTMLAHDLRNPLGPIANAAAIMKTMEAQTPAIAPVRQIVERQLDQLRRVIADMRDVTRITQARLELHREALPVRELVRRAIESAQAQIDAGGHHVELTIPDESVAVLGDSMRLAQALSHLLLNAAKFSTAPGAIDVSARADDALVHICVKDQGQGIAPEFLPHVFEPFAQESQSKPRTNSGLGVGLTIAQRLVQLHGGDISASSAGHGQGAQFTLTLPLATAAIGRDATPTASATTATHVA